MRSLSTLMLLVMLLGVGCARKAATPADPDGAEAPVPIARRVKVGSSAPPFRLLDQFGTPVSSEEVSTAGGGLLIFVTTMDDPAARPAQDWTRLHHNMLKQQGGIEVLWITGNTVEENAAAAKAGDLRVALLADPRFIAASSYGLPDAEEGGRPTLGLWSVLIGSDGLVHRVQRGLPPVVDVITDAKVQPGKKQSGGFFN